MLVTNVCVLWQFYYLECSRQLISALDAQWSEVLGSSWYKPPRDMLPSDVTAYCVNTKLAVLRTGHSWPTVSSFCCSRIVLCFFLFAPFVRSLLDIQTLCLGIEVQRTHNIIYDTCEPHRLCTGVRVSVFLYYNMYKLYTITFLLITQSID